MKSFLNLYNRFLDYLTPSIIISEFLLFYLFVKTQSTSYFILFLIIPYLIPCLLFRITFALTKLKEGAFYVESNSDINWQMAFKFQSIYGAIPQLEKLIIALGLYSPWLRLWGSTIGKNVFWTSHTQVLDRSGLVIGDYCFFGHECALTSHVTSFKRGKAIIYYKKIKIGNHVFLGARSNIAPGVVIQDGTKLPFNTITRINQKISPETFSVDDGSPLDVYSKESK